jgi:peptidoglycan/LPS O-acetylase OafA/YrhL
MSKRLTYLDGLRGVAAATVVIDHLHRLLPVGDWEIGPGLWGRLASHLINFPFSGGAFSVYVFFVISGVVIAGSASGRPLWPEILISRYLRLTIPMLFSSVLCWILLCIFPDETPKIAKFISNYCTNNFYQTGPGSFFSSMREPIWGEYAFNQWYYNPVIWSMRIELYGSLSIYTIYRFIPRQYIIKTLVFISVFLIFANLSNYLGFTIGALLFEWNQKGRIRARPSISGGIATAGLLLGAISSTSLAWYPGYIVSAVLLIPVSSVLTMYSAGAGMVVFALMSSTQGKLVFSSTAPQFLGRISYSLYLLHLPFLFTGFGAIFLLVTEPIIWPGLILWLFAFVATSILSAYAMTVFVDEPSARMVRIRYRPNYAKLLKLRSE